MAASSETTLDVKASRKEVTKQIKDSEKSIEDYQK